MSLKALVEVYGEIASVRMHKIRQFVLHNRSFLSSIHDIFTDVLAGYVATLSKNINATQNGRVTFLAHNGKNVAVFLSANTGFYGDVIKRTFNKFIADVRSKNLEVTIVGKSGLNLFTASEPSRPHTYFSLPDYGIDKARLDEIIRHLVQYDEIYVYYGEYVSIINMRPNVLKISSGASISAENKPKTSYIFEPSVEKILMFFETEIFASLFDQSVRESQLAKFASRILAMDTASQNIQHKLSSVKLDKLKLDHRKMNQKQVNMLSSVIYQ